MCPSAPLLGSTTPNADPLDEIIHAEMKLRRVPGVSLVIIDGGRIVDTRVYGTTTIDGTTRITTTTLFQAGSISKAVSAFGALRMVEAGRVPLDADVNEYLKSWQLPGNRFQPRRPAAVPGTGQGGRKRRQPPPLPPGEGRACHRPSMPRRPSRRAVLFVTA